MTVSRLPEKSVIFNYQPAGVGKTPFVTLGILTSKSIGGGYKFDGSEEQEYITLSKETVVSVNAYGKNAFAMIQKLEGVLRTSYAMQALKAKGMAIPRVSPIRDLTSAIGGGYEERAQIDLTIVYNQRVKTEVLKVETVEIKAQKG